MPGIDGFLIDQAVGVGVGIVLGSVKKRVLEPLLRRRAEAFFQEFTERCFSGLSPEDLQKELDSLLENEARAEVLFDAARAASSCRSRKIGPRIIAIQTARAFREARPFDDLEEDVVWAAQVFLDAELLELRKHIDATVGAANDESQARVQWVGGDLQDEWYTEEFDLTEGGSAGLAGSLNLGRELGRWVNTLQSRGLFIEDIEESLEDRKEYAFGDPRRLRIVKWTVTFKKPVVELARLIAELSDPPA